MSLLIKNSISPLPLHKCLMVFEEIQKCHHDHIKDVELLALAHVAVFSASNLKFGPEVGVNRRKKDDAPIFEDWLKVFV